MFRRWWGIGCVPELNIDEVTPTETRFYLGTSGIAMNADVNLVTKGNKRMRDTVDLMLRIVISEVLGKLETDWMAISGTLQQLQHKRGIVILRSNMNRYTKALFTPSNGMRVPRWWVYYRAGDGISWTGGDEELLSGGIVTGAAPWCAIIRAFSCISAISKERARGGAGVIMSPGSPVEK